MMMGKAKSMDSGEDIPIHMVPPKRKEVEEPLHLVSPPALTHPEPLANESQQTSDKKSHKPEPDDRDAKEIPSGEQIKDTKKRSLQALEEDMLKTLQERKKDKGKKVETAKGMKRPAACKAAAKRR